MVLSNEWNTAFALDEEGNNILVTRRIDIEAFQQSGKLPYRIEVRLPYKKDLKGMPLDKETLLIGDIEEALRPIMEKDKLAILTGNYLGGGKKYWVFYSRNVDIFFDRLEEALEGFPLLPLEFEAEEDPSWEEYHLMAELEEATIL